MPSYVPTQDVFVNGNVADATDLVNEFNAISQAFDTTDGKLDKAVEDVEDKIDELAAGLLKGVSIDGGEY